MLKRAGIAALVLALAFALLPIPVLASPPESIAPMDPAAQAKADYQEALKLIQAGRNAEALPLLERALKVLPGRQAPPGRLHPVPELDGPAAKGGGPLQAS